jgi:hypothetical protein
MGHASITLFIFMEVVQDYVLASLLYSPEPPPMIAMIEAHCTKFYTLGSMNVSKA